MKLVYLPTAFPDIVWMRRYYRTLFPQGARKAREQLMIAERLLLENPNIGRRRREGREFRIALTPFSVIYRMRNDTIEIVRIWDGRQDPGHLQD